MNDTLHLGLDLATATARLLAVARDGTVVAERQAPLAAPESTAAGWAEQRPDYLAVAIDLLRAVASELGRRAGDVRALSITGTSGTVVPCDADGRAVGPAVLYNDQRAGAQASRLTAAGFRSTATSPLARLGWLQENTPAARYLHTPDVVAAGLLGRVPPTDTSHALKAGIDPVAAAWDEAALEAAAVPRRTLPDLVAPGTVLGTVTRDAAAACGLPDGVILVAGMTDGCTAQLAAGAVRPGDTVGVLGTTLVLKGVSDEPVDGFDGALYSHHAPDGRFWPGGASNVGARLVRDEFGDRDLDELELLAARRGPVATVRYPLPGVGERFPFSDPHAVGFRLGAGDDPVADFRALLEGVAFVERLGLEALRRSGVAVAAHRVTGGGSRNRLWNRIRATVLGAPVTRPPHASSGYGAALLALAAVTGETLARTVERTVDGLGGIELYEPDPAEQPRLEESFQRLRGELERRGHLAGAPAQA